MRSYICSECEAKSTRKWNLERHVKTVHGGAGSVMVAGSSARATTTGPAAAAATVTAGPSSSPRRYGHEISRLVEERLESVANETARAISLLEPNSFLHFCAYACEDCLTIDLRDFDSPILQHKCDSLWLLDFPELNKNKQDIFRFLIRRIPRHVARILKQACGGGRVKLKSVAIDAEHSERWALLNEVSIFREDPEIACYNPVKLGFIAENHWARRAIRNGETVLNDNELMDFINRTGRTFSAFNIEAQTYFMMFELEKTST